MRILARELAGSPHKGDLVDSSNKIKLIQSITTDRSRLVSIPQQYEVAKCLRDLKAVPTSITLPERGRVIAGRVVGKVQPLVQRRTAILPVQPP